MFVCKAGTGLVVMIALTTTVAMAFPSPPPWPKSWTARVTTYSPGHEMLTDEKISYLARRVKVAEQLDSREVHIHATAPYSAKFLSRPNDRQCTRSPWMGHELSPVTWAENTEYLGNITVRGEAGWVFGQVDLEADQVNLWYVAAEQEEARVMRKYELGYASEALRRVEEWRDMVGSAENTGIPSECREGSMELAPSYEVGFEVWEGFEEDNPHWLLGSGVRARHETAEGVECSERLTILENPEATVFAWDAYVGSSFEGVSALGRRFAVLGFAGCEELEEFNEETCDVYKWTLGYNPSQLIYFGGFGPCPVTGVTTRENVCEIWVQAGERHSDATWFIDTATRLLVRSDWRAGGKYEILTSARVGDPHRAFAIPPLCSCELEGKRAAAV